MLAAPFCLAWTIAPPVQAKTNLTCTVVDESGKPVAKQEITLTSSAGKQQKKKTNDQGEVKFGGVDDGLYTIGGEGAVAGKVDVTGNADQPCKYVALSAAFANSKLQEVMQLVQNKKYAEAEAAAKKLVELMPGEGAAHYVLAVAYAYEGKEDAVTEAKKAAELNPDKFKDKVGPIQMQILNQQAETAKQKGDFPAAIKRYEAILAVSPNDPTVYYNMAVTYAGAKDYVQALKNIDLVLAIKPDDQEAKLRKAAWEKSLDEQLRNPLQK